jgi:hypothetical protein
MEARYQLRQSPLRAGGWPVHNLTDLTVEAPTGLTQWVTSTWRVMKLRAACSRLVPVRFPQNLTPAEYAIRKLPPEL